MPCYFPLRGYRSRSVSPTTGKRAILFSRQGFTDLEVLLPCGRCIGCRLEYSRQWAMRCVHELSLVESSCFLTLTYDDAHLPLLRSLDVRHLQLFMKRLRKRVGAVRFFACGEYGDSSGRPHYHVLLFGFDFPDKLFFKLSGENRLYRSSLLEELWTDGHSLIGEASFESAAYVSRYILKKRKGKDAESFYRVVDESTGEILGKRVPEFLTMSRRPGIGKGWFEKFGGETYGSNRGVVVRGRLVRPPRYYDQQLAAVDPDLFEAVRRERVKEAKLYESEGTSERLKAREAVARGRQAGALRSLDNET